MFFDDQGRIYHGERLGRRLPSTDVHGDLAIVEVPKPPIVQPLEMQLIRPDRLAPGTEVWSIGRGSEWLVQVRAGAYLQPDPSTSTLLFEDLRTPRGSSGGPVVGVNGLIGMIITTSDAMGITRAFRADRIRETLMAWQIPVNFLRADTYSVSPAPRAASSPARRQKEWQQRSG